MPKDPISHNPATLAVSICIGTRTPVILWGPPGVGKTAFVRSLGEIGIPVQEIRGTTMEPTDIVGIPMRTEITIGETTAPTTQFALPRWLVEFIRRARTSPDVPAVLFVDELTDVPRSVQAAFLRLFDAVTAPEASRSFEGLPIPPNVTVVAAANPPDSSTVGQGLAKPTANRFCHIKWDTSAHAAEWFDWLITRRSYSRSLLPLPLPVSYEEHERRASAQIHAFLTRRGDLRVKVPDDYQSGGMAWPSERTWTMAARLLGACEAVADWAASENNQSLAENLRDEVAPILVAGCVGDGASIEFLTWLKEADLPDPEALLADPASFRLSPRGDVNHAVLTSVAAAVAARFTHDRWNRAWQIIERAAKEGAADVAAVAARMLLQLDEAKKAPVRQEALEPFIPILQKADLLPR